MSDNNNSLQPIHIDYDNNPQFTEPELIYSTSGANLYRARKTGKFFMLKTAKDDSSLHLELLKREYELSIGFSHPHIINVYTYEPQTVVGPAIVMEYVDGRNLNDFLAERPSLSARIRIFEQLLSAVSCLHKADIIHNDLKPQNILITRANDDVKLIDFGLADNSAHFLTKEMGGTPQYASPELLAQTGDVDARSDIYSIGRLMVTMFGKRRYHRICKKCLQDDRNLRYENIDALLQAWHGRKVPEQILMGLLFSAAIIIPSSLYVKEHQQYTLLEQAHEKELAHYDSLTTTLKDRVEVPLSQQAAQLSRKDSICHLYDQQLQKAYQLAMDSIRQIPYKEFSFSPITHFYKYSWQIGNAYTQQERNANVRSQLTSHFDALRNQLQQQLYDSINDKPLLDKNKMSEKEYLYYTDLISDGKPFKRYRP